MVILITGASHTGKTLLAQKLLEKYSYPYFSIDHLKMGLIRSGNTALTPQDDDALEGYLWNIVREMVKTAIENKQNLIAEGCYIPFSFKEDFSEEYLSQIRYICLVMSRDYIERRFSDIREHACAIERRLDDRVEKSFLVEENEQYRKMCEKYGLDYVLIDEKYGVKPEMFSF